MSRAATDRPTADRTATTPAESRRVTQRARPAHATSAHPALTAPSPASALRVCAWTECRTPYAPEAGYGIFCSEACFIAEAEDETPVELL